MRIADYVALSFSNLWKMRLRTFLTVFGVTIGIGALISMVSFGGGIQKNVTDTFNELELFNSMTIFPGSSVFLGQISGRRKMAYQGNRRKDVVLDDKAIEAIMRLKGVTLVFPEVRFPALIKFNGQEEFKLIQAIPANVASSHLIKLHYGKTFLSDDEDSLIISDSFLSRLKIKDFLSVIGKKITISSLAFDRTNINPLDLPAILGGGKLPFSKENYEFTIIGIMEGFGFRSSSPIQPIKSDVFIPSGSAQRVKKLPISNIWDLFRTGEEAQGFSALNVRLSSIRDVDFVKAKIEEMGFEVFALIDELKEIKKGFFYLNMILAAVGMIALVVASLGIVNTMIMSILERYREIGIMKAIGAGEGDIKKIFFFESALIGLSGGVLGVGLGWIVTRLINLVVNYFLAKQGVPFVEYFNFPLRLLLGGVAFAVIVSMISGIYPALRAAKIDPVETLRRD